MFFPDLMFRDWSRKAGSGNSRIDSQFRRFRKGKGGKKSDWLSSSNLVFRSIFLGGFHEFLAL